MAAFNWIVVDGTCPVCSRSVTLRCQTHVASSYNGNESGRFHDREYRLGQPMAWWPRTDERFGAEIDEEACYVDCPACLAHLYTVIRFREKTPEAILDVGPEERWPDGYFR